MKRAVLVGAGVLLMVSALTGCDDRPCLQSHIEYMPIVQTAGKSTYVQMLPMTVCDKYGPEKKK